MMIGINTIEIWQPRYHDRTVLIATYKVSADNIVKILKGAYAGTYKITGQEIRKCPQDTNGTIAVYAVPITKLERI